jgi:hypothetical protein
LSRKALHISVLDALKMSARKIPQDVTTRWNSTYDMLLFALEYREAMDKMSGDKMNNLRKYELSEEEWGLASQLRDVLKASRTFDEGIVPLTTPPRSSRMRLCSSLERYRILQL